MKTPRSDIALLALIAALALAACQPDDGEPPADPAPESPAEAVEAEPDADVREPEPAAEPTSGAHMVEVTARDFAFEAPEEIPSGWTTFRMENVGQQEHFLVLWPLPEGKSFEDAADQIQMPFVELDREYQAGELDRGEFMEALGAALPDWFESFSQGAGGPGLISPGRIAQTTVHLEPGTYVMECYVRAPDGQFHNMLGMMRPLTVTTESSGAPEPEADIEVTLSNYAIDVAGDLSPGRHVIRVHMAEQPEGLLPHDIHLARLDDAASLDELIPWMDWVDNLQAPAPAGFLGGVEHMPAGSTGYFTVDLEPGRYALISEAYAEQGMVREFTVE